MKKYLVIAALFIVPVIFFLHNSISNPSEFATYTNAQRPNPIQLAGFALGDGRQYQPRTEDTGRGPVGSGRGSRR